MSATKSLNCYSHHAPKMDWFTQYFCILVMATILPFSFEGYPKPTVPSGKSANLEKELQINVCNEKFELLLSPCSENGLVYPVFLSEE